MKSKIKSLADLQSAMTALRKTGAKVVFTNGCFDLLHVGHVRYLKEAGLLGDYLIVALNSDESVRKIKGVKRPIVPQSERAELLAALECVDFVTIFNEVDPYLTIEALKPDFLVKGGDWAAGEIIGGEIVKERGGEVVRIPFIEGASTTNIVEKIIDKEAKKPVRPSIDDVLKIPDVDIEMDYVLMETHLKESLEQFILPKAQARPQLRQV